MFIRRVWTSLRRKPYTLAPTEETSVSPPPRRRGRFSGSLRRSRRQHEESPASVKETTCGFWATSLSTLLEPRKKRRVTDSQPVDYESLAEEDIVWKDDYVKLRYLEDSPVQIHESRPDVFTGTERGIHKLRRTKTCYDLTRDPEEDAYGQRESFGELCTSFTSQDLVKEIQSETEVRVDMSEAEKEECIAEECQDTHELGSLRKQLSDGDQITETLKFDLVSKNVAIASCNVFTEAYHLVSEAGDGMSCDSSSVASTPQDDAHFELPFMNYADHTMTSADERFPACSTGSFPEAQFGESENEQVSLASREDPPAGSSPFTIAESATSNMGARQPEGGNDGTASEPPTRKEPSTDLGEVVTKVDRTAGGDATSLSIGMRVVDCQAIPGADKGNNGYLEITVKPLISTGEISADNRTQDGTVQMKLLLDI